MGRVERLEEKVRRGNGDPKSVLVFRRSGESVRGDKTDIVEVDFERSG